MRIAFKRLLVAVLLALLITPPALAATTDSNVAIVPKPAIMQVRADNFSLGDNTTIIVDKASAKEGEVLATRLRAATGFPIWVMDEHEAVRRHHDIILLRVARTAGQREGYRLRVQPQKVEITGNDPAGVFYGIQTFLQLLPPQVFGTQPKSGMQWNAPCVAISDEPRLPWRGFMLDSARHFINKTDVEKLLDVMALHKLNVFQWHLCDDQGWRIEIKKYPLLTQVGAWRNGIDFGLDPKSSQEYNSGGRYGGFYSQDDVREIVQYANERHIMVVPEIEMPGHSTAALAAYPEYSCTGGPFNTDTDKGILNGVYCAGNDKSFEFLQDVLAEVFALFPAPYVHIGGDEVRKENWHGCAICQARIQSEHLKDEHELQAYFIARMQKFINEHGKKMVGWTEIAEGGLAPDAVLMDWKGGGPQAAAAGHKVVMACSKYCYFDYYQSEDRAKEPVAQPAFLPIEQVYAFEPVPPSLPISKRGNVLGVQGEVWTEFMPNFAHVEYMAFPRLCALAEVAWSPVKARQFADFSRRLDVHTKRLEALGVNYRHPALQER